MLVSDVMQRQVATVGPNASLAAAARMTRDQDVGCLPVLEDGRLIGMITDRDIVVRGVAEGLDPNRATVRQAMSSTAVACSPGDTVEQAREVMAANLIKHLPVLDRHGHVVGLISSRDLSGQYGRCRPHQVTFFRRVPTSSGRLCDVEVAKLYLSPAAGEDTVLPTALARFAEERGLERWDQAADSYEVKDRG